MYARIRASAHRVSNRRSETCWHECLTATSQPCLGQRTGWFEAVTSPRPQTAAAVAFLQLEACGSADAGCSPGAHTHAVPVHAMTSGSPMPAIESVSADQR